jgi:hypothetical protein
MTLRAASRARFQNNLGQIGLTQVAHATRSDWHFTGGVAPSLVGLQEGVLTARSAGWPLISILDCGGPCSRWLIGRISIWSPSVSFRRDPLGARGKLRCALLRSCRTDRCEARSIISPSELGPQQWPVGEFCASRGSRVLRSTIISTVTTLINQMDGSGTAETSTPPFIGIWESTTSG